MELQTKNSEFINEPMLMPFQNMPFNGDVFVKEEILFLKDKFNIKRIVETGTFFGYTSKWMSENFEMVFTIEINPEYSKFAKNRFSNKNNIILKEGSSIDMLPKIISECNDNTLIFLDAHWNEFCPLKEELRIIGESKLKPVIAIHDFLVPNNPRLGYDNYNGQPFVFEWLQKDFDNIYGKNNYEYYYNSEQKSSGAKRGVIYVIPIRRTDDYWISKLPTLPVLKKYSQCGEEGIIEFILNSIGHYNRFFVDMGAWNGDYLSNTKYFTENYGYSGLLIDGNNHGNDQVKQEWITKDNVCNILDKYKCPQCFSLLSLDLDGNDYDIISSILIKYKPRMIVCEINTDIPLGVSKKIKYNPNHQWNNDDYFGFSFSAAQKLAENNGYRIVYQHAWNIFMVRKDILINPLMEINIEFQPIHCHPHNEIGEWEQV